MLNEKNDNRALKVTMRESGSLTQICNICVSFNLEYLTHKKNTHAKRDLTFKIFGFSLD